MTRITVKCPRGHKHLVSPGSPLENVNNCGVCDSRPLSEGPKPANARLIISLLSLLPLYTQLWQGRESNQEGKSCLMTSHAHAHAQVCIPKTVSVSVSLVRVSFKGVSTSLYKI